MGNDVAPEGMTTDGTSLFTSQSTSKNVIRKYSITNETTSFSLTKTLNVTVAGATTFRALSYYNGSIYAVDNGGTKGVYEINASTGTYTNLGTHSGSNAYQAVRYGNRVFVIDGNEAGTTNNLTVYTITDGVLGASTSYNLTSCAGHILGLWGIGVVGTSTDVTGFWVNSSNSWVSFFSCSYSILTCNTPFADADNDDDVDMDDFADFQNCYGPIGPVVDPQAYPCWCFDPNSSGQVDSVDLQAFTACASGPEIRWVGSTECP